MVAAENTHRLNFRTDAEGVQWVCRGLHDRSADCEWELASANLAEPGQPTSEPIDLYDKPIDLRPVPKPDVLSECIEYLRSHGDHYGVQLLEAFRVGQKDSSDS